MCRREFLWCWLILSFVWVNTHANEIKLEFITSHQCELVAPDSIKIENLSRNGTVVVYHPNTVYYLTEKGVSVNTDINNNHPEQFYVSQNYPNPFTEITRFDVHVKEANNFVVSISDLAGRIIATDNRWLESGSHTYSFTGAGDRVYLLNVDSPDGAMGKKMISESSNIGGTPSIRYNGLSGQASSFNEQNLKSTNDLPFALGDQLRFTSYVTNHSGSVENASVTASPLSDSEYHTNIAGNSPARPSSISGSAEVTAGQAGITYSVSNVSGITYNWNVPSGWTITSGQNNASITVKAGSSGGTISVTAQSTCGISNARTLTAVVSSPVVDNPGPVDMAKAVYYAAPNGRSNAAGTYSDPYDLATVIRSSGPASPGDLIILKEGTYNGRFISTVRGTPGKHIVFAAEPGKRVTINANTGTSHAALLIRGEWVIFRELEVTNSNTNRLQLVGGINVEAPNSKVINCIIHNNAGGIGSWSNAVDSELYGNIIYNNGYFESRGRGHGIYMQNRDGTQTISNNILFFGYGFGIHAYTEGGSIQGFDIIQNVWFRTGASMEGASGYGHSDGLLIGGHQPIDRTRLIRNHSWTPAANGRSVQLGFSSTVGAGGSEPLWNEFIELRDNYIVGNVVTAGQWRDASITNNQFFGASIGPKPSEFPNNTFSSSLPTGTKVVVQNNKYDSRRFDLVIYNWGNQDQVNVNLSNHLQNGQAYQIYSVFDLWGSPVASGTYQGGNVSVPMGTVAPPQPNGFPNAITGTDDPGKTFGVFILRAK